MWNGLIDKYSGSSDVFPPLWSEIAASRCSEYLNAPPNSLYETTVIHEICCFALNGDASPQKTFQSLINAKHLKNANAVKCLHDKTRVFLNLEIKIFKKIEKYLFDFVNDYILKWWLIGIRHQAQQKQYGGALTAQGLNRRWPGICGFWGHFTQDFKKP